jgi:hypothetical protein
LVPEDARAGFLEKIRKFADAKAFAIRVAPTRPDGQHFLVQMWREDVNIVAVNPFNDPREFRIGVYQTGTRPVPTAVVDAVLRDLKDAISDISRIDFVDKK